MKKSFICLLVIVPSFLFPAFLFASMTHIVEISYNKIKSVDSSKKYLFFFHNYYVEVNGPEGECKYYEILKTFQGKGYSVISEIRSQGASSAEYAKDTAHSIERLLAEGVSPEHIVVTGHSKGGVIALQVASQLKNPDIKYAILAGCGIKPLKNAYPDFKLIKGNILSLYANSDNVGTSCSQFFSQPAKGTLFQEIVLESPKGHRLFFKPETIWVEPMFEWLQQIRN